MIGGVGLARYLDPELDATRFAPMPSLGWQRAYRSGDLVRAEPEGLAFVGRADDQVKVGGRRIEPRRGRRRAAATARGRRGGRGGAHHAGRHQGARRLRHHPRRRPLDRAAALARLRESLPAALVPLLAEVDDIPTRTSGKVDRDALPGRCRRCRTAPPTPRSTAPPRGWPGCGRGCSARRRQPAPTSSPTAAAAWPPRRLVAAARERYPQATVADVYENPGLLQPGRAPRRAWRPPTPTASRPGRRLPCRCGRRS
ncbi:hypothetical protein GCM10025868_41060 [Angustibacter aerolatus]|uniref:AMP-binding enzyme C-terminal domain-containing protein n=1 Tax=Angustibacter aerolatus TaxID=1162965 RepID=A0ABQ6JKT9_9ACTN|nr:hypothetical protein GCM10025868_41060 [Angustibacter aerolatus]